MREKDCTACGDCAKVCPQATPNEFEIGLATRKAIYSPFAQAVPSAYLVDPATCLGHDPLVCGKCIKACKKQCIDFDMQATTHDFEVGTIVVATGMDVFDPTGMEEYGYGRFPNVVTSLEFERLINAGGPTLGEVVRPGDRKVPRSVAFVQCVGSRSHQRHGQAVLQQRLLHGDHQGHPDAQGTLPGDGDHGLLPGHPRLRQGLRGALHPQPRGRACATCAACPG